MLRNQPVLLAQRTVGRENHFNLLRLLAAIGVMISHAYIVTGGATIPQPLQEALYGISLGTISVYTFFTISGFLICRSYQTKPNTLRFIRHRAARILPALIAVTFFSVALGAATTTTPSAFISSLPSFIIRNIILLGNDQSLPGTFSTNPYALLNPSLWTLPYEVMCYVALLLIGRFGLLRWRTSLLAIAAATSPLVILSTLGAFTDRSADGLMRFDIILRYGMFFLIGALFWLWKDRVILHPVIFVGLWIIAAYGWFTILFFWFLLIPAISYSVIYLAHLPAPTLLNFNRIGDYSYGLYLFGFPIQQLVEYHTPKGSPEQNIAISIPLALLLAIVSWHLIERPSLELTARIDP